MAKQQSITTFLKKVKQVEFTENRSDEPVQIHEQFYQDCMKVCENVTCITAISELNRKKEEIRTKIGNIEEAISRCKSVLKEKDDEIQRLQNEIGSDVGNKNASSVQPAEPDIASANMESFVAFGAYFTNDELSHLRSIGPDNSSDSTFVLQCVKFLYKQNLHVLKHKSVTGKSTKGEVKEPISPNKYKILTDVFDERVNITTQNAVNCKPRAKGLNKFIKNAINNVNRTNQINEVEKDACKQLEMVLSSENQ